MTTQETKTRFLGTCPICEGEFKLTPGANTMVHHGYQRPGDGMIHGDCFAVGELAYELSCEITKTYRGMVETSLTNEEAHLARLKSGTVTLLHRPESWKSLKLVDVCIIEVEFPRLLESKIRESEYKIRTLRGEIERLTRLINNWTLKPVKTFEEKAREEQAARDVRKAEKDAAKAIKKAEKDARQAKADALKAKRQAIIDDFKAQFLALAAKPFTPEVKAQARELARKVALKKHSFMDARDMDINDTLVALELATTEVVNGRTYYTISFFFYP